MSEKGVSQKPVDLVVQKKQIQEKGWSNGKGLGRNLQGKCDLIDWPSQDNTFGLGFRPSWKEKQQMKEKKKNRRLARLEGRNVEWGRMEFPHINQSFVSAGWVHVGRHGLMTASVQSVQRALQDVAIQLIDEEESDQLDTLIFETSATIELDNWSVMEIPTVLSFEQM